MNARRPLDRKKEWFSCGLLRSLSWQRQAYLPALQYLKSEILYTRQSTIAPAALSSALESRRLRQQLWWSRRKSATIKVVGPSPAKSKASECEKNVPHYLRPTLFASSLMLERKVAIDLLLHWVNLGYNWKASGDSTRFLAELYLRR
eukprot:620840-Amphidinium_carterae.1